MKHEKRENVAEEGMGCGRMQVWNGKNPRRNSGVWDTQRQIQTIKKAAATKA
jgi:hypothetical protein